MAEATLDLDERLRQRIVRASRVMSVAIRFTEEEAALLTETAKEQGTTLREWSREALLREARTARTDALFTEIVAMRMMLNSLLRPLTCGEIITADDFTAHMTNIRTTKHKVALDILQQYATATGKEQ